MYKIEKKKREINMLLEGRKKKGNKHEHSRDTYVLALPIHV